MGRKLSVKERASTLGLISIVETTKNEKFKMRAAELLHQYDQDEKDRAAVREKVRLEFKQNKEIEKLRLEITTLKKSGLESQVKSVQPASEAKTKEQENAAQAIQKQSECEDFLMSLLAYLRLPEYKPTIMDLALERRVGAKLANGDTSKAARPIAMLDLDFKQSREDQQELDRLKRETRDPATLFSVVMDRTDTVSSRNAQRALDLIFGWTEKQPIAFLEPHQKSNLIKEISVLPRRTDEEILDAIRYDRESKILKTDWQARVTEDNQRARSYIGKALTDAAAFWELLNYRQCQKCTHVSHITRTKQGRCHHCDTFNPLWCSLIEAKKDFPYCVGVFPCWPSPTSN